MRLRIDTLEADALCALKENLVKEDVIKYVDKYEIGREDITALAVHNNDGFTVYGRVAIDGIRKGYIYNILKKDYRVEFVF